LLGGEVAAPMTGMNKGCHPIDQFVSNLSPEQKKTFDANVKAQADLYAGGQATPADIAVVEEAIARQVQRGDHSWIDSSWVDPDKPKPEPDMSKFRLDALWKDPSPRPPKNEGILPPPPPVPQQNAQLAAGTEAGAEAASSRSAIQPNSEMRAGAAAGAAAAQAPPIQPAPLPEQQDPSSAAQAPPPVPQQQDATTAVSPKGVGVGPAGDAGDAGAPGPPIGIEQMIWKGEVGDDAYQRALENPMSPEDFNTLREAANNNQIPHDRMPRVVQQLIATDSVEKAEEIAKQTGQSVNTVLGMIAQQRAGAEFDESDLSTAFTTLAHEAAVQEVGQRRAAGDPTASDPGAVVATEATMKKDPGFIEMLSDMWRGMDTYEQLGLVVGIAGSVIALVNTLMGGSGITSLISGALGLGGLGYAFGGGDMLSGMMGGQEKQPAAPPVTAPGPSPDQPPIVGSTPSGQPGAPTPQADAPGAPGALGASGADPAGEMGLAGVYGSEPPKQDPRLEQTRDALNAAAQQAGADPMAGQPMSDDQFSAKMTELQPDGISIKELQSNPEMLRGASDARVIQIIQSGDPALRHMLWAASWLPPAARARLGAQYGISPEQVEQLMGLYAQSKKAA